MLWNWKKLLEDVTLPLFIFLHKNIENIDALVDR